MLHSRPKIGSYLPEAAMVILVGMVVGLVVHLTVDSNQAGGENVASSLLSFSPQVFFIILLPVSKVAGNAVKCSKGKLTHNFPPHASRSFSTQDTTYSANYSFATLLQYAFTHALGL